MITTTVGAFLQGTLDTKSTPYGIYVFRNGGDVFYVGRSVDVGRRLEQHLRPDCKMAASYMGRIVWKNTPASLDWQIDLYTLEDCLPLVQQHYPLHRQIDVDIAEMCMIRHLHPCCNKTHNNGQSQLPAYVRDPFDCSDDSSAMHLII